METLDVQSDLSSDEEDPHDQQGLNYIGEEDAMIMIDVSDQDSERDEDSDDDQDEQDGRAGERQEEQ